MLFGGVIAWPLGILRKGLCRKIISQVWKCGSCGRGIAELRDPSHAEARAGRGLAGYAILHPEADRHLDHYPLICNKYM